MTRFTIMLTSVLATAAVALPAFTAMPVKLIWNASASSPVGLYEITAGRQLEVTDLVAANPPDAFAPMLAERGYLPRGVPLIKRVRAVAGQTVCRNRLAITVDGIEAGTARERDGRGRTLPVWQGCRRILAGEIFLMNWEIPNSMDGRYFGPVSINTIIGHAIPLWTDEDRGGQFEWRAPTR